MFEPLVIWGSNEDACLASGNEVPKPLRVSQATPDVYLSICLDNLSSHMCKGSPLAMQVPACRHLVLRNVNVPAACIIGGPEPDALHPCVDGLVLMDIRILDGTVAAISASSSTSSPTTGNATEVDAQQGMALPCFTDMHTHIGG